MAPPKNPRRRYRRHSGPTHRPLKLIGLFFSLIVLGSLIIFSQKILDRLNHSQSFTCHVNDHPCPQDIIAYLTNLVKKPYFFIDLDTELARIQTKFPYLNQISLVVPRPLALSFTANYQVPQLLITDPLHPEPQAVTASGYFSSPPAANLTTITCRYPLATNQDRLVDSVLPHLITLVAQLPYLIYPTDQLTLENPDTLTLQFKTGLQAIINPFQDIPRQLSTLQAIFRSTTIRDRQVIIDVRFNKPVIKPTLDQVASATASSAIVDRVEE